MPPDVIPPPAPPSSSPLPPVYHDQSLQVDSSEPPELEVRRLGKLPPWLISMIVHTLVLLLLALLPVFVGSGTRATLVMNASIPESTPEVELQRQPSPQTNPQPTTRTDTAPAPLPPVLSRSAVGHTELWQPVDEVSRPGISTAPATADSQIFVPQTGLQGRTSERRRELALSMGGSEASEEAVERALEWLAAHQRPSGAWSFDLQLDPCRGRCSNGANNPGRLPLPPSAATGLALLPFLGAGYTHTGGKYARTVSRGMYYLRGSIRSSKGGGDLRMGSMYGHGIATLALTECYAMTGDRSIRDSAEQTLQYIAWAQHAAGGWRYEPGEPGDMTVSGWQVLALKSGSLGDLHVPTSVWDGAMRFVDSLSSADGSRFGYMRRGASKSPTAIGLLLQMYFGHSPDSVPIDDGLDWIADQGPSKTDLYFDYYGTMALFHSQHRRWHPWNYALREHLIRTQATQGHESGSWHFHDQHGDVGGRLYSTAMAALILETYYRYLPLYGGPVIEGGFPLD